MAGLILKALDVGVRLQLDKHGWYGKGKDGAPYEVSHVDAETMTKCLVSEGHTNPAAEVETVILTPFGEGVGMMSTMAKAEVTYKGEAGGLPTSFIFKFAPKDFQSRLLSRLWNCYAIESSWYGSFADEHKIPLTWPKCFYAAHDGNAERVVMLLEDLGPEAQAAKYGKEMKPQPSSQTDGISLELAKTYCLEIAKMHAQFWNKDPSTIPVVLPMQGHEYHSTLPKVMGDNLPKMRSNYLTMTGEAFNQELYNDMILFVKRLPTILDPSNSGTNGWCCGPNTTLTHGDFRRDNIMHIDSADGEVSELVILDFQMMKWAHAEYDIAYCIGTSCAPEDQTMDKVMPLLREYHARLVERGVPMSYTFEECVFHYCCGMFMTTSLIACVAVGGLDFKNEGGSKLVKAVMARFQASVKEINARQVLDAMVDPNTFKDGIFDNRVLKRCLAAKDPERVTSAGFGVQK